MQKSASVCSFVTVNKEQTELKVKREKTLNIELAVKYRDDHLDMKSPVPNSPHSPHSPTKRKDDHEKEFKRRSLDIGKILHNNILYEHEFSTVSTEVTKIHRIYISGDIEDKKQCYKLCIDLDHEVIGVGKKDYLADRNIVIKYEIELRSGKRVESKKGGYTIKYEKTKQLIGFVLAYITVVNIYIDDIFMREEYQKKYWFRLIRELNRYIKKNELKCTLNEKIASPRIVKILEYGAFT